MKLSLAPFAFALAISLAVGCATKPDAVDGCDGVPIEPLNELVVVDDEALARAGLGFEDVANAAPDPQAFARSLLDGYAAAAPDRAARLEAELVCPWLRRTPDDACDASCTRCERRALALDASPFRLAAVANRTDLGRAPDALSPGGEGRLVFAVTHGDAKAGAAPLAATVIFEYALVGDRASWTARFHALSRLDRGSDAFARELAAVVTSFVGTRGAPGTLSQVRVDDAAFGAPGDALFAELAPAGATGALAPRPLRNTPDANVSEAVLVPLVTANEDAIVDGRWLLPDGLRARTIHRAHEWSLPGAPERARKAFALDTCNGCHGSETSSAEGFHVTPWGAGEARLSRFLRDEGADDDELRRRSREASAVLCAR